MTGYGPYRGVCPDCGRGVCRTPELRWMRHKRRTGGKPWRWCPASGTLKPAVEVDPGYAIYVNYLFG